MVPAVFLLYSGKETFMKVLESSLDARLFYRERYGIDIADYDDVIRQSLENLFFRGKRLSAKALYAKFAQCGINLSTSSIESTRFFALTKKVQPEPFHLSHHGAKFWYMSQPQAFTPEDLVFMALHFPGQMQRLYPSLWKSVMLENQKRLPDYIATELFDREECVFQQHCERNESKRDAAIAV